MGLTTEQRQARRDRLWMVKESRSGAFLSEWLKEATEAESAFAAHSASLSEEAREAEATAMGFKTWRAYVACRADIHRAVELFATNEVFAALWRALKERDPKGEHLPWGFSPTNAGTPTSILRGIEIWHSTPKFTQAEIVHHHRLIADAARTLTELLEQVSPARWDKTFDRFALDAETAEAAFRFFRTPAEWRDIANTSSTLQWFATSNLESAGITPLWAVKQIQAMALQVRPRKVLPTKVRAKTAFRTFMIGEVAQAIATVGPRNSLPVGDQLIADAVALLINADCSLDDVRKGLAAWRAEDLEAGLEEIIHPEK